MPERSSGHAPRLCMMYVFGMHRAHPCPPLKPRWRIDCAKACGLPGTRPGLGLSGTGSPGALPGLAPPGAGSENGADRAGRGSAHYV